MFDAILDIVLDAALDTLKLIPFLFLTYLLMELLEHKTSKKTLESIKKAGKLGPLLGGLLGAVPQCGFSAAASSFYGGRVITLGTLIAIYLSTSDEMLPIMISEGVSVTFVIPVVLTKVVIGITAGFIIDLIVSRKPHHMGEEHIHIHEMCTHDHCKCEKGIVRSAIIHTLQISGFVLLVSLGLGFLLEYAGAGVLEGLVLNNKLFGPLIASLIGLIPNCAASVVLTQLFLHGALSFGSMMAGLLTGAGVGILVLAKVNHSFKETAKVIGLVYGIGAVSGILIGFIGF